MKKRSITYTRVFLLLLSHVIFIALILAKTDAGVEWSWAGVFSPLFAIDTLSFIFYIPYLHGFVRKQSSSFCYPGNKEEIVPVISIPLLILLKLSAELLLTIHLELSVSFLPCGIVMTAFFTVMTIIMLLYTIKPLFHHVHK